MVQSPGTPGLPPGAGLCRSSGALARAAEDGRYSKAAAIGWARDRKPLVPVPAAQAKRLHAHPFTNRAAAAFEATCAGSLQPGMTAETAGSFKHHARAH